MSKELVVKLYDKSSTFKATLSNKKFSDNIEFRSQLGYGLTDFRFTYNVTVHNSSISFMDEVKVIDPSSGTDITLYRGKVYGIKRVLTPKFEGLEITCVGIASLLSKVIYMDGANYSFNKTDDPADIIEDILGQVNTQLGTYFTWTGSTIVTYGTTVNIDFDGDSCLDALSKVLTVTDSMFRVDGDGTVYFKAFPSTPDHRLTLGNNVVEIVADGDATDLVNDYVLERSGGNKSTDSDASSIASYGQMSKYVIRSELADSTTADEAVSNLLDANKNPKEKFKITVNDNYDLESLKVGQMVTVVNCPIDITDKIITRLEYLGDNVILRVDGFESLENALFNVS